MAHFAELNSENTVLRVIVVDNDRILDEYRNESEQIGIQYCRGLYGQNTHWIQTSYNGNFRKNYAGVGYIYDPLRDAFIEPQPYPSWTLNNDTCKWEPPVPCPNEEIFYIWDEDAQQWL